MNIRGWQLFSLVAAAILGGYALASGAAIFLGAVLPMVRAESVLAATLLSFIIYTAAVIWVFLAGSPRKAWLGLLVPALLMAGIGALLGGRLG